MVLEVYLLKRRLVGGVWALIKGGFLDTNVSNASVFGAWRDSHHREMDMEGWGCV